MAFEHGEARRHFGQREVEQLHDRRARIFAGDGALEELEPARRLHQIGRDDPVPRGAGGIVHVAIRRWWM